MGKHRKSQVKLKKKYLSTFQETENKQPLWIAILKVLLQCYFRDVLQMDLPGLHRPQVIKLLKTGQNIPLHMCEVNCLIVYNLITFRSMLQAI